MWTSMSVRVLLHNWERRCYCQPSWLKHPPRCASRCLPPTPPRKHSTASQPTLATAAKSVWNAARPAPTPPHLHEKCEPQRLELWALGDGHHGGGCHVSCRALDGGVDGGSLRVPLPKGGGGKQRRMQSSQECLQRRERIKRERDTPPGVGWKAVPQNVSTQFPHKAFGDWPPHMQAKQGHSLPPVAGHQVRQRPSAPQQRRHKGRDVVGGRVLAGAQLRLLLPAAHLVAVAVPPACVGKV